MFRHLQLASRPYPASGVVVTLMAPGAAVTPVSVAGAGAGGHEAPARSCAALE